MALVTDAFEARWKWGDWFETPPAYVGHVKPTVRVAVRRGKFKRGFFAWDPEDDFATLPGQTTGHPWQATWTPSEDYIDIPGVLDVDLQQDFTGNGITRATIQVENVVMVEQTGNLGHVFRTIERGYLSPWRGYTNDSLTFPEGGAGKKNSWFQRLDRNIQVTAWVGYGPDFMVPMWTGLVDDLDLTSKPAKITITARDFGQALTDQHVFGRVRGPSTVREPVVFADRRRAYNIEKLAGKPRASSFEPGHPVSFAIDKSNKTAWFSQGHKGPDVTEWMQFHVPHGRYEQLYLDASFGGMELYVSVFVRNKGIKNKSKYVDPVTGEVTHNPAKVDGQPVPNGWLDLGKGHVEGYQTNEEPYIKKVKSTVSKGRYYPLPKLELGTDSAFRLHFRKLRRWKGDGDWHAGVQNVYAVKRKLKPEAKKNRWVLVDDVTDVAKVLMRWGGFKEWEVETAGVRLKENFVVNRANSLMDPIKKITDQTGFVFFMGDPSLWEDSIGVPILRSNSVFGDPSQTRVVRDTDLLTGLNAKITDEPLGWPIFVRGKLGGKDASGRIGQTNFFAEPKRVGAKIYPPWYKRFAGVMKHVIHYDANLKTEEECKMACYLIALAEAMQSATAVVEFPANPAIQLDEQLAIRDTGTGLATRLYIASRSISFHAGENTSFVMTVGGSLIDTPDIQGVLDMIAAEDWSDDDIPVVIGGHRQDQGQELTARGPGVAPVLTGSGPGVDG